MTSATQFAEKELKKSFCSNEETYGFDFNAGINWIYPMNYPIREYQFNIVKNALFENTLVSLPTGLGKTFIAAVIMLNYFRWYPNGKIIFMAPTKPLVRQQMDACYDIVGIPRETTVELTGSIQRTNRTTLWREKRVFFITPHVLQNDLETVSEIASKIKCIVIDEAHKARGTYAYCEVVRRLNEQNRYFRVLALSATPGSTVKDIMEVSKTLLISHLEVKTDESTDVAPYVYRRTIQTVIVPLDEKLQEVRDIYLNIIESYTRILIRHKVFNGNYSKLTKGRIFMTLKDYQSRNSHNRGSSYNEIVKSLTISLTLYHGLELLTRHGLRGFLLYFEEHIQKPLIKGNLHLHEMIADIKDYLGPMPNCQPLPDGSIPNLPKNSKFGHPKYKKLADILSAHFIENDDDDTRVIVFFEYKDSVIEAYALLLQYQPLIKARVFMGQSSVTQKQQKNTLTFFRNGDCNTLLSTSIGEEGLDVGEVDLIICFDISSKSPIRMVQRMGRTGRKREGKIVILVTKGKEEETLKDCLMQKKSLNDTLLNSSELHTHLYQDSPKMIPDHIQPECTKMHITIRKPDPPKSKPNKSLKTSVPAGNIKSIFKSISLSQELSNVELIETEDRLQPSEMLCFKSKKEEEPSNNANTIDFAKQIEKQRSLQSTFSIGHSKNTELLTSVLQYADSKRFNIPQTQIERSKTNKTGIGLQQTDIRTMFKKQNEIVEIDDNINQKINDILSESTCEVDIVFKEIRDFLTISYSNFEDCFMCRDNLGNCNAFPQINYNEKEFNVSEWTQPESNIFDCITKENLRNYLSKIKTEGNRYDIANSSVICDSKFKASTPNKNIKGNINASKRKECTSNDINNFDECFNDDEFVSADLLYDLLSQSPKKSNNDDKLESFNKTINQEDENIVNDDFTTAGLINDLQMLSQNKNNISKSQNNAKVAEKSSRSSKSLNNIEVGEDDFISADLLNDLETLSENNNKVMKTPKKSSQKQKTFNKSNIIDDDDFVSADLLNDLEILSQNNNITIKSPNKAKAIPKKSSQKYKDLKNCNVIDDEFISADLLNDLEILSHNNNKTIKSPNHIKSTTQKSFNNIQVDDNDEFVCSDLFNQLETLSPKDDNHNKTNLQEDLDLNESLKDDDFISPNLFNDLIMLTPNSNISREKNNTSIGDLDVTILEENIEDHNNIDLAESPLINSYKVVVEKKNDTSLGRKSRFKTFSQLDVKNLTTNFEQCPSRKLVDNSKILNSSVNNRKNIICQSKSVKMDVDVDDFVNVSSILDALENSSKKDTICNKSIISNVNEYGISTNNDDVLDFFKLDSLDDAFININSNSNSTSKTNSPKTYKSPTTPTTPNKPIKYNSFRANSTSPDLFDSDELTCDPICDKDESSSVSTILNSPSDNEHVRTPNSDKNNRNLNSKLNRTPNSKDYRTPNSKFGDDNVIEISSDESPSLLTLSKLYSQTSKEKLMNTKRTLTMNRLSISKTRKMDENVSLSDGVNNNVIVAEKSRCVDETSKEKLVNKKRTLGINCLSISKNREMDGNISLSNSLNNNSSMAEDYGGETQLFNLLESLKGNNSPSVSIDVDNKRKRKSKNYSNSKKYKRRKDCSFLEMEAEVDDDLTSDSNSGSNSDLDKYDESFVNEATQDVANTTTMQAFYLQSIKSPVISRGQFKIPALPMRKPEINIYSQDVNDDNDSYLDDSFCVDALTQDLTQVQEPCELERAEKILRERKKNRKKSQTEQSSGKKKLRRIITYDDDDSD